MKLATIRTTDGATRAVRVDGTTLVPLDAPDVGTLLARPDWRELAEDATPSETAPALDASSAA